MYSDTADFWSKQIDRAALQCEHAGNILYPPAWILTDDNPPAPMFNIPRVTGYSDKKIEPVANRQVITIFCCCVLKVMDLETLPCHQ